MIPRREKKKTTITTKQPSVNGSLPLLWISALEVLCDIDYEVLDSRGAICKDQKSSFEAGVTLLRLGTKGCGVHTHLNSVLGRDRHGGRTKRQLFGISRTCRMGLAATQARSRTAVVKKKVMREDDQNEQIHNRKIFPKAKNDEGSGGVW